MKYNYKGKFILIPDEDIERSMKTLNMTRDEAIQLYLEDEGLEINEEQEQLTQKAKANKTTLLHARETIENKKTERKPKENPVKEGIIAEISRFLVSFEGISNLKVTNKSKLIEFTYNNSNFKLDLVQKREKKATK